MSHMAVVIHGEPVKFFTDKLAKVHPRSLLPRSQVYPAARRGPARVASSSCTFLAPGGDGILTPRFLAPTPEAAMNSKEIKDGAPRYEEFAPPLDLARENAAFERERARL